MSEGRQRKIESELQRVLAELVSREVKDPRVGNVTITAVSLAPDLATARVFFVPFGRGQDAAAVSAGLTRAGGFLRGEVGRRLGLRHAPRLSFEFDDSFDRAERLTKLIEEAAAREDPDRAPDPQK